jgi:dienelactone hydrolase
MTCARTIAASCVAMIAAVASGSAQVRETTVDIKATDGATLKASAFETSSSGRGVLLLPQCRLNRHSLDGFAGALAESGIYVLSLDYRGFGESPGKLPPPPFAPQTGTDTMFAPTISADWIGNRDIESAYEYLQSVPGVTKDRIVVGGADCGAAFAADLAAHHPDIRGLFLLSGRISGGAAAHIAATPWLPVFGAGERGAMPIAYKSIESAIATSKNTHSMMKLYPGTGHGVQLLSDNPTLQPALQSWIREVLTRSAPGRSARENQHH